MMQRPRSHYKFLDEHFNTILINMGKSELVNRFGNFTSSGDKYYEYRHKWERVGISFFHGAAMYHLMELFYYREIRKTPNGWVDPCDWIIANYRSGYNLSQYMEGME